MTQTQVKMRPMLFSTPMVQAILEGRKTQTRRIIKESFNGCLFNGGPHPCPNEPVVMYPGDIYESPIEGEEPIVNNDPQVRALFHCSTLESEAKCPYGKVGDVLWVRETFVYRSKHERYYYKADHPVYAPYAHNGWKSSLFMPKEAARIFLKITDIRVERLQDISEEDAAAEGIEMKGVVSLECDVPVRGWKDYLKNDWFISGNGHQTPEVQSYQSLWESINGKDSWNLNPWVWAVSFERIDKPENV